MHVSVLADFTRPLDSYHQHVYNKIGTFDEIRTRGKSNFENEYLKKVPQLLEEIIIY